jgi:hypothetical protein
VDVYETSSDGSGKGDAVIIATAGRRVDAENADKKRFPMENAEMVRQRCRAFLEETGARTLVSSAACGTDLIALPEAGELGLRRRVVLPFSRERFRETSVTDRPGDWGPIYDRVLDEVSAAGDLVVLQNVPEKEAYAAANAAILDEALAIANAEHDRVEAVLIWDGESRGEGDMTESFGAEAKRRGLMVREIRTI